MRSLRRAVVGADAHRDAALLAKLDKRQELFPKPIEFRLVLLIRVLANGESLLVRIVARVDAHLFDPLRRLHRRFGLEVDVRDQGNVAILRAQIFDNLLKVRSVLNGWRSDPHDLTAGRNKIKRLSNGLPGIHRVTGDHGLHADRIACSDTDFSHTHLARFATGIGDGALAVSKTHLDCSVASFGRVAKMSPTSKNVT